MEEISINILVDAKNEYTKQLTNILVPYIYEGVESIYQDALNLDSKNVLKQFQNLLQKVPKWNQEMIETETKRIIDASKCSYLGDLLTAVFVANAKILTAVATVHKGKKIQLHVPQISEFIHKCYIESAREFYKNPYLFDKSCRSIEKHRNLRESLGNINNSIVEAVRKLLPLQEILQQYLGESFGMHEEDITTPQKEKMTFDKKFMKYADEEEERSDSSTPPPPPTSPPASPPTSTVKELTPPPAVKDPSPPAVKESTPPPAVKESTPPPQVIKEEVPPTLPTPMIKETVLPTLPTPVIKETTLAPPTPPPEDVKEVIKKTDVVKVINVEGGGDDDDAESDDDASLNDEELERLEKEIEKEMEAEAGAGVGVRDAETENDDVEEAGDVKDIDLNMNNTNMSERQNRTRRIIRRKKHKEYVDAEKKMNKELGFYNDAGEASDGSE